jgi:hypothetical protein
MRHNDPQRERVSALRRSRVATHGLVLGAAAGSLGVAGALGLSAALHPGTSASTTTSSSQGIPGSAQGASGQTQGWVLQGSGDDDGELEGGLHWVPLSPSQQFGGGGTGGGAVTTPHAQTTGS